MRRKMELELSFCSRIKSAVAHHLAGHVNHIEPTKIITVNKRKIIVLKVS